jgi:hypothetical protein
LWRNQETVAVILRPKPRNRRGDFEAQITNPSCRFWCPNRETLHHLGFEAQPRIRSGDFEAQITKSKLSVLRPKPENPPPPWFWGSTKKLTTDFEAKPGETVTTSFEVKLAKIVNLGFEAQPRNPRS